MFLIFEELDTATLHLPIRQDTEKHVLQKYHQKHLKAYHVMAVHPEGSQFLVRDADKHVHYGLWRPQLVMILELLQLIGKIDVIVPYEGTKSHCTKFAILRNRREHSQPDPGFKNFDFDYAKKAICAIYQKVQGQTWRSLTDMRCSILNPTLTKILDVIALP
jgi:hypothetical protein